MLDDGLTSEDKELIADVHKCENSRGVNGILALASCMRPFAYVIEDLDADPYLVNTPGGTLDLRTFEYLDHDPANRITKVCGGSYGAAKAGPIWEAFLARVLPVED